MANRIRVKLCGMTQKEDLAFAAALGVDAIGLIFAPQSPRFVSLKKAKQLLESPPLFMNAVAVFVNPSAEFVQEIINELPINTLQFHGEESPEFCRQFGKPYIKAVPVNSESAIYNCAKMYKEASSILLDTPSKNHGGSGNRFDWELIPNNLDKLFILAGGLDATNIKSALRSCSPWAVDVCSGVEVAPGIKDYEKMRQFIDAIWEKK